MKQLHDKISADVFSQGVTLKCSQCTFTQTATTKQAAGYLRKGWPEHCGQTMYLQPSPDPLTAFRQGEAMGKAIRQSKIQNRKSKIK